MAGALKFVSVSTKGSKSPSANQPASRISSCPTIPPFDSAETDRSNIALGRVSRMRRLSTAARGLERAAEFPLRVENSHQPTRRRERKMQGFKSPGSAQRFLSVHAATYNTFNVQRHLTSAKTHRAFRASAVDTWRAAGAAA